MFRACVIKIEPGETGVLNKQWGGGLQERDYTPGYHLSLGPLHTWNRMDTTVQTLNMLKEDPGKRGQATESDTIERVPALRVKSSDGADVTLDITIKYQIEQGRAWQVFKEQGGANRYKDQVLSRTKNTLIYGLSTLSTEEFFDPSRRKGTQDRMMDQLGAELSLPTKLSSKRASGLPGLITSPPTCAVCAVGLATSSGICTPPTSTVAGA